MLSVNIEQHAVGHPNNLHRNDIPGEIKFEHDFKTLEQVTVLYD